MAAKKEPSAPNVAVPAESSKDALLKMQQAYAAFLDRLQGAIQEGRTQVRDTVRQHARATAEIEDEFARQRAQRVEKFVSALKSGESEEPDPRSLRSARLSVEDELQQLEHELRKRDREALSKSEETIEKTREQMQQAIQTAFQEYVGSVRSVWADMNGSAVDARTIAGIGELLIAAAMQLNSLKGT